MSEDAESTSKPVERVPTGVPGLDTILRGGLLRGGVYLLHANPGSGKTILGNQICFHHVAAGGRALFVTLLSESHSRMLGQLQNMSFFDPSCIGDKLSYITAYQGLEKTKLKGLLGLLRKTVRDHKATFLVIDGVVTAGSLAETQVEMKKFVHELQVFAELVGCTTLLLTGPSEVHEQYALRTMVDGLIEVSLDAIGMEAVRTLCVPKFRGSEVLLGRHLFDISDAGVTVYPRMESLRGNSMSPAVRGREQVDPSLSSASFGIDGLDTMLGGAGLRAGSMSMTMGTPGSGKTLLGLSLLDAGTKVHERGLYFGFFETPDDLCRKAAAIGIPLSKHVKDNLIDIVWEPPFLSFADGLAAKLLAIVREHKIRRLFIDGLGGLRDSLVYPERSRRFFGALCTELRELGVVTLLSDETASIHEMAGATHGLIEMLDNVILLRQVEDDLIQRRRISVAKMREGVADPMVRELEIGARGIVVSLQPGAAGGRARGEKKGTQRPR